MRERGDCDDDQDGDNAEGLSVSGLLVFDGEDLHYTERQKMQHEQQVKWYGCCIDDDDDTGLRRRWRSERSVKIRRLRSKG